MMCDNKDFIIVKKVNRMIGLTRRTFHYMDEEVFRLLYTSLTRPHITPHLVDIAQLEIAQRIAPTLVDVGHRRIQDFCLGGTHPAEATQSCITGAHF